ncbi:MAG: hypothetical protein KGI50_05275 [Patescibacteria group bacterium]|nr:hypothetical protein [Patescibacteria group bacterium]MDE2438729.1 hypothetical protein [Patescibacteria group bacterium]
MSSLAIPPQGTTTGLKGTGFKSVTQQNFTPEQMNLFSQLFSGVSPDSYLSKLAGGDQGAFQQLEAPALRQFSGLQEQIANRFSQAGARKSSGFYNAQNTAASEFAQNLQAQRLNLQNQARQQLFQMSHELLSQRPYENHLIRKAPKGPSFMQQLLGGIGTIGGAAAGAFLGNPSSLGSLGNIFGSKSSYEG